MTVRRRRRVGSASGRGGRTESEFVCGSGEGAVGAATTRERAAAAARAGRGAAGRTGLLFHLTAEIEKPANVNSKVVLERGPYDGCESCRMNFK